MIQIPAFLRGCLDHPASSSAFVTVAPGIRDILARLPERTELTDAPCTGVSESITLFSSPIAWRGYTSLASSLKTILTTSTEMEQTIVLLTFATCLTKKIAKISE
jgi:hypothetical protein